MSSRNKLVKAMQNLFRQMMQLARVITKTLMNWLLRSLMVIGRSSKLAKSGFILPTVTMVILVVILLTTAMVFRSFDRSKNASNVRVSQEVLAAATPALDRAKAKIAALLEDPTLPRATPTDVALYQAISGNLSKYTLGDEQQLDIRYDINSSNSIQTNAPATPTPLDNDEKITTAWRFPVDTDNDGKFDSYTLYGIYFRTPNPTATNNRARTPIESRTAPMDDSVANPGCQAAQGTFAGLVGNSGWYRSGPTLKKSFYVFAATVPFTTTTGKPTTPLGVQIFPPGTNRNRAFSAIEYQQDRAQIPLSNNAVVYEDDLEITPGSGIKLNGRIQTNGNFITGKVGAGNVEYYQVSSYESCFFQEENAKITVGGNLLLGSINGGGVSAVRVDLFQPNSHSGKNLGGADQSVSGSLPSQAAYNSQAFTSRINQLVTKWTNANTTSANDPTEVKEKIPTGASVLKQQEIRRTALENYFKDRMRRVPYAESTAGDASKTYVGSGDTLRPPDEWIYPVVPSSGATNNSITLQTAKPPATEPTKQKKDAKETLVGDRILVGNGLPATWWDNSQPPGAFVSEQGKQQVKPDTQWNSFDGSKPDTKWRYRNTQVVPLSDLGNTDRDGFWEENAAKPPNQPLDAVGGLRVVTGAGVYTDYRVPDPNVYPYPPIGAASLSASFLPSPPSVPNDLSTLNIDESQFKSVWPDSMPMWQDTNRNGASDLPDVGGDRRGDLVMRATAVYHYKSSAANTLTQRQKPIACVSSYYDPSTSITAKNPPPLLNNWGFGGPPGVTGGGTTGRSNNGISYDAGPVDAALPTTSAVPNASTGLFPYTAPGTLGAGAENPANSGVSILDRLYYQANLIFPNGRFVNQPLRDALTALSGSSALTIAQQSAIDSTICSLKIADGTLVRNATVIPDGAIYETSFLDAREIKAIEQDEYQTDDADADGGLATFRAVNKDNKSTIATAGGLSKPAGDYNLPLEERQPLEIRATVLDLNRLRQKAIGGTVAPSGPSPEYLLPDSGIIYATRDDALPDLSEPAPSTGNLMAERKSKSPVDYKLDPTRRPNAIMLVNGSILARGGATPANTYTLVNPPGAEKGLILATNLPAYIKADTTNGFNKHQTNGGTDELEEFTELLGTSDYTPGSFYSRQTPENKFACRSGQPGISGNCPGGDFWRPATVLADSVTLLSDNFRFGFRNEGDYDLRNNQGYKTSVDTLKKQGFLSNNFVTNGLNSGATINATGSGSAAAGTTSKKPVDATYASDTPDTDYVPSSYFNNFVTPIQRRGNFPEYLMEVCIKLPVSLCGDDDWFVDPDTSKKASSVVGSIFDITLHKAGTTAVPAVPKYQRYARRVAFLRKSGNTLVANDGTTTATAANQLVPLGIASGTITKIPYGAGTLPTAKPNALVFKTVSNNTDATVGNSYSGGKKLFIHEMPAAATGQPLLAPALQFQNLTTIDYANVTTAPSEYIANKSLWLQKPATGTIFNLAIAGGDSPANGARNESNGGLQNFVRFIENWATTTPARISGSFIQFKRSAYATAPFRPVLTATSTTSPFGYTSLYSSQIFGGSTAFYVEPKRYWGFDVALLSQMPDLFSQRFTTPSAGDPNEFYREVGRDDPWVQALLCAKLSNTATNAVDTDQRPTSFCTQKTGG
ncbi:hormogonium polysaccharide biosynthesis protein HpsA [Coleofasciculus sp. FACHB-1120]|uniref:hormogonium polysaccharide biosynthesis protein HpsA n=1 Tax=Coleofasciculus sp. FACHB-1120 TaxID=2692783 RepID=UPI00168462E4|nr:hormogonium polysaccharide biosynthesis protein HpsA [Coleofasciculus sp. FACHB-1120]MBD2741161.1 hypothetical protein [Coleofasciculus sp. FACHB-1120]